MSRVPAETRVQDFFALREGASVNAIARQTGASKMMILKLLGRSERRRVDAHGDLCADTKLIPCWHVGARDADADKLFGGPTIASRTSRSTHD